MSKLLGVLNIVSSYATEYDEILAEKNKLTTYANKNFIGDSWTKATTEANESFNFTIKNLREEKEVASDSIFESTLQELNSKVSTGTSADMVAELQLLALTKVSKTELEVYLTKYATNYLAIKYLKDIAEKNNIDIAIHSLDDLIAEVKELQGFIKANFYNRYTGEVDDYYPRLILNGDMIRELDNRLGNFIIE